MIDHHRHDWETSLEICAALQGTFGRPGSYFEICSGCAGVREEVGRVIKGNNPLQGNTNTEAVFEEARKLRSLSREEEKRLPVPETISPLTPPSTRRARSSVPAAREAAAVVENESITPLPA